MSSNKLQLLSQTHQCLPYWGSSQASFSSQFRQSVSQSVVFLPQKHDVDIRIVYTGYFLIVYCKLQSTQLDRVISKDEVKVREVGIIHRWFTGVVLLG